MTLQRKSSQCDVEVIMSYTNIGDRYAIQVGDKTPHRDLSATETYDILVEAFEDVDVKLPARFVIEFGQHVINSLMMKMRS